VRHWPDRLDSWLLPESGLRGLLILQRSQGVLLGRTFAACSSLGGRQAGRELRGPLQRRPAPFKPKSSAGASGLSAEQRKRLTIGVELVTNPSVIFMDEPSSGAHQDGGGGVGGTTHRSCDCP
jgi:hypothetical protein